MTSASDPELVDAVRAGEENAFEELFRRYRPRVYSFVQRRVRDDGRAEDLTQEAFLSALRRLRETDSEVVFRPWIYEIARNATIDHFRRHSRAEEVSVDNLRAGDHPRLVGDWGPDRELAVKQQLETLRGAFAELSHKHERVLVMRELEGLSYREIGEEMELTRHGVESTLFRARRRLKREFVDLETGRRCLTVRGAMGRLAEGLDLRGDRGKVARHVRRCTACRVTAGELGLPPDRPSRAARVAALLPLPFLVRRAGAPWGQGVDLAGAIGAKGTALVAALALAGGGAGLGALSVTESRDPSAPREAGRSAVPRADQPKVPAASPAPASPRRPTRRQAPAAAARGKRSPGQGARDAGVPSTARALGDREPRPSAPPGGRAGGVRTPKVIDRPSPSAGALKRGKGVLDDGAPSVGGPISGSRPPSVPAPSAPSVALELPKRSAPTGLPVAP